MTEEVMLGRRCRTASKMFRDSVERIKREYMRGKEGKEKETQ